MSALDEALDIVPQWPSPNRALPIQESARAWLAANAPQAQAVKE